jgi:hypothetical protein
MASTTLHSNEQNETNPSTDINGQHLAENKAEENHKEKDHSSINEENAKDSEKEEDEEIREDQDERDKQVIIIQPTRRIRTRFFTWGKCN